MRRKKTFKNSKIAASISLISLALSLTSLPSNASGPLVTYVGDYADCSQPLTSKIITNSSTMINGPTLVPPVYNHSLNFLSRMGNLVAFYSTECPALAHTSSVGVYNLATQSTINFPGVSTDIYQGAFLNSNTLLTAEFNAQGVGGRNSLISNDLVTGQKQLLFTMPETDPNGLLSGTTTTIDGIWVNQLFVYLLVTDENCKYILDSNCTVNGKTDRNSHWTILKFPISDIQLRNASVVTTGSGQVESFENFVASPFGPYFAFHSTKYDADWGDTFYEINSSGKIVSQISENGPFLGHQWFATPTSMFLLRWYPATRSGTAVISKLPIGKSKKWGQTQTLSIFNQAW